jgi:hypothetical protein
VRLISRTAAVALSVVMTLGAAAVPCMAGDATASKAGAKLTRLSPASRSLLATARPAAAPQEPPAAAPSSPSSFFKSTRGKVTLALMGAGAAFTFCSINHDRKPVKSPIR